MDGVLSTIGSCALIAFIFYIFHIVSSEYEDKERKKRDLEKYAFSGEDISNPKDRKIIIERRKEVEANIAKNKEDEKKELIMNRVYSYKYEDAIYRIFAPYAVENKDVFSNEQKWMCYTSLNLSFVSYELGRILSMSEHSAIDLLREFKDNHLVEWTINPDTRDYDCSMGYLLLYHWDIISKNDKNFSSWIDSHDDIESKESVEKRRKQYLFVNNHL